MYSFIITLHSILRWFFLVCLLYALYISYKGLIFGNTFSRYANIVRIITSSLAHLQLIIGILLYFISPVTKFFLHNFKQAIKLDEFRFFGMEHSLLMILSIVFITIGSSASKRRKRDREKYKSMAIWFTIALLVMFLSIPWPFLPFTANRPYFRPF